MTTTTPFDLDQVLAVADEPRRLCQRTVNRRRLLSVFKQERWGTALCPHPGLARRTAAQHLERWPVLPPTGYCPPRAWRWVQVDGFKGFRTDNGRGKS